MTNLILEAEELLNHIQMANEKVYHFQTNLFNDYFYAAEPKEADLLYGYKSAKIEQDVTMDYVIEARKEIKALNALIYKMLDEAKRQEVAVYEC